MTVRHWFCLIALLVVPAITSAAEPTSPTPERRTWEVAGVEREALIAVPASAKTEATPVVFLFHGHGGRMALSARNYSLSRHWPEAIVVCAQGLKTPGVLSDREGKLPGWQSAPEELEDRDLKFFDVMLKSLKADYRVDEQRIYAAGHSNGASFTYLLWATRGEILAAVGPASGAIRPELQPLLKPKPAFIVAGEQDKLVRYQWQERTIHIVRKLNQCGEPKTLGEKPDNELVTAYPSPLAAPLETYIYPGGHQFPPDSVLPMVKFFKSQVKPTEKPAP